MTLRAENVTFGYHADQPVLRGVSLEVRPGCVTALFGPNGCGKSTLLRCLNGSLRPHASTVLLDGRPLSGMTPREVACRVAVVPQDTPTDVPLSGAEMVMLGRYARWGAWGQESEEDRDAVRRCMARLDAEPLAGRLFSHLSGGERQRIVLARALAQEGHVLLLDEPASHLDIAHQLELYRLVRALAAEGQAVLMICHDLLVAPMFVDAAVLMARGRAVATGKVGDVLAPDNLADAFGLRAEIAWGAGTVRANVPLA